MTALFGFLIIVLAFLMWFAANAAIAYGMCWAIDSIWHTHAPFWPVFLMIFILSGILRTHVTVSKG